MLPSIVEPDYEGEIQIMLWTPVPSCFIPTAQWLTHLVLFSSTTPGGKCGMGGFSSTYQLEILWTSYITMAQLILVCSTDGRKFKGLVPFVCLSFSTANGCQLVRDATLQKRAAIDFLLLA